METKKVPKEAVREYVERRIAKEIKPAVSDAVRRHMQDQLEEKVASLVQDVLSGLDDHGAEAARSNIDITRMVTEEVIKARNGDLYGRETIEVPVAGRANSDPSTTRMTLPKQSEPDTITKEAPLEGGNVDDPETVEYEVENPGPDSRMNAHMNSRFPWVLGDGFTVEERLQAMPETEDPYDEMDLSETPVAGWQPTEDNDE